MRRRSTGRFARRAPTSPQPRPAGLRSAARTPLLVRTNPSLSLGSPALATSSRMGYRGDAARLQPSLSGGAYAESATWCGAVAGDISPELPPRSTVGGLPAPTGRRAGRRRPSGVSTPSARDVGTASRPRLSPGGACALASAGEDAGRAGSRAAHGASNGGVASLLRARRGGLSQRARSSACPQRSAPADHRAW